MSLKAGRLRFEDSALVRAARFGRVLVVDEADKAPLEVVSVLKALAEDGELALGDGRRLVTSGTAAAAEGRAGAGKEEGEGQIVIHPGFRLVVLANPPGFPFQGNDCYRECGDCFAAHPIEDVGLASREELLRQVACNHPQAWHKQLISLRKLPCTRAYSQRAVKFPVFKSIPQAIIHPTDGWRCRRRPDTCGAISGRSGVATTDSGDTARTLRPAGDAAQGRPPQLPVSATTLFAAAQCTLWITVTTAGILSVS